MSVRSAIAVLLLALAPALRVPAQTTAPLAQAPPPGSEITVTLVTFGVGSIVFERFGHNALRFQDAITGEDVAYHWGLFDFDEPDFIVRFLTGDTRYSMGAVNAVALIESERRSGRPTTLQRLNLTPTQAYALRDFVRWNARDENKFYRYDYFRDNCSTRLRDALDRAVNGAIRRSAASRQTAITYRNESLRLTDGDKPVQAGIDIALGRPADVPLSEWDSFFIPMRLRDAIRTVRIQDERGAEVPLVAGEMLVPLPPEATPVVELAEPPRLVPRYLLVGVLLATIVVALRLMMPGRRSAVWALAAFGTVWSLVAGVVGVILLLAWLATRHVFWAGNENVLLLSPISLALAVLVPAALVGGRLQRPARILAAFVAGLGVLALLLTLLPGGEQNAAVVALLLPVHLALAWALGLPWTKRSPRVA